MISRRYGTQFMGGLEDLKDKALAASHRSERNPRIGGRQVDASWLSNTGGNAYLRERRFWLGSVAISQSPQVRLRVFDTQEAIPEMTTYCIDFGTEAIDVYRTMIVSSRLRDVRRVDAAQRSEQRLGLAGATEQDMEDLYSEMLRGASGDYVIAQPAKG